MLTHRSPTAPLPEHLVKQAAPGFRLPPDPQTWAQVVYQQALDALPLLANFEMEVLFEHQDIASSTALGVVLVRRKPAPSLDSVGQVRPPLEHHKVARIPVVIHRGMLAPLDLIIARRSDGQGATFAPLNDRRLRQAMFRDDVFEGTSNSPGNSPIGQALYPSSREFGAFGNSALFTKGASLLPQVLTSPQAWSALRSKVARIEDFAYNDHAAPSLEALVNDPPPATPAKVASLPPTVALFLDQRDGTYLMKTANPRSFSIEERVLTREQLVKAASPEALAAMDTEGGFLLSEEAPISAEPVPPEPPYEVLTQGGFCKVKVEGKEVMGVYFPNLLDLSATLLPIALFTNGTVHAVSSEIHGQHLGSTSPTLPRSTPQGHGCFYRSTLNGLEATVPMDLLSKVSGADGSVAYLVQSEDGTRATVKLQPGVRRAVSLQGTLLLPDDFVWMPLLGTPVEIDNPHDEVAALDAEPKTASPYFVLTGLSDHHVRLEGPACGPFASSGEDLTTAALKLAALGVPPEKIEGLFVAAHNTSLKVATELTLQPPASPKLPPLVKSASPIRIDGETRDDLVKLAATLADPDSVDALLGLSMVSEDTVAVFTSRIPEIERVQSLLCEMLLASRLGLRPFHEELLVKGVQSLEHVIEACFQLRMVKAES